MTDKITCLECGWIGVLRDAFVMYKGFQCPNCEKWNNFHFGDETPKKKMLFVDDRTRRIHYALNNFPEYDVTIATCVPEALRLLCSQQWDKVSFDIDLNGHDFQDTDDPTCGMEIVRYLEKCGGWGDLLPPKPEFQVHSKNLMAANDMIVRLRNMNIPAYYSPIIYKVENMTYDEKGHPK